MVSAEPGPAGSRLAARRQVKHSSGFITKSPLQTWLCKVEGICSLRLAINEIGTQDRGRRVGRVRERGTHAGVF